VHDPPQPLPSGSSTGHVIVSGDIAEETAALEKKLAEAVGKAGEVTTADGAVKLEIIDQILFPVGEADLTPRGKEVLAKVGAALKDVEDKQIWVQGHTDDQPIIMTKPKPEPPSRSRRRPLRSRRRPRRTRRTRRTRSGIRRPKRSPRRNRPRPTTRCCRS